MFDFVLVVESGPARGRILPVGQSGVLAVEGDDGPRVLAADAAPGSGYRAMLEVRPGGVLICDLECKGATVVNGVAVDFATLRVGDLLAVGGASLRLEATDWIPVEYSLEPSASTLELRVDELLPVDDSRRGARDTPEGGRPPSGAAGNGPAVTATAPAVATAPARDISADTTAPMRALRPSLSGINVPPTARPRTATLTGEPFVCDRCGARGPASPKDLESVGWICPACFALPRQLAPYDPTQLGSYEVLRYLARGGMGAVYDAAAKSSGLHVAVKVLLNEQNPSETMIRRFVREQQITESLRHPHVIRCFEVGRHQGKLYIASEFLTGGDAAQTAALDSPLAQALQIGADLFRALGHAHAHDIVHRDVKPANVLLTRPDARGLRRGKLADFGLAKNFREQTAVAITTRGDTGGSVSMMSPEQLLDFRKAGPSADLYSGASTVFRLLTADTPLVLPVPLHQAEIMQVAPAILKTERVSLRQLRPEVPEPVAELIDQLVARDASHRKGTSADVVADTLQSWVDRLLDRP